MVPTKEQYKEGNTNIKSNSNPFMKKASSLTNIETQVSPTERSQLNCSNEKLLDAAADTLVNSCNQYLDQNRTIDIKIEREPSKDNERKNSIVRFIPVVLEDGYYSKNNASTLNEIDDTKQGNKSNFEKSIQPPFHRGSVTYGTLPHVLKKQQKHVRSLIVPKMRKMFEKSKSAEPEGQISGPSRTVKLKIQIDPPKSPSLYKNKEYGTSHKDGTESVSSFVAVNKNLLEVVDNKRKKLAGERQRSASFSSNGGDEWSFSEGYDQTPEDSGTTDNSITSSKTEPSSNHQMEPGLANDVSSNVQRISSNKSGSNQSSKTPISNNSEILTNQPVDSHSSSSSNENNANVLNNKSFVNKCVSKVKNLVNSKQSSPQPGQ